MNFRLILTYFSILTFSTFGFLANTKADDEKIFKLSNDLENVAEKITYESQYILGIGDILFFNFPTLPSFNTTQEIDRDGKVRLVEIKRIKLQGFTIDEAEKLVNKRYEEFIYDPNVEIKIQKYRPTTVYLRGEVKNPGLYTFPSYNLESSLSTSGNLKTSSGNLKKRPTLFELLQLAKGVSNYADLTKITVLRDNPKSQGGGKIKTELDLLSMLINGDQSQNIGLSDNDNILVKKSSKIIKEQILTVNKSNISPSIMTVYVTGNVVNSGPLQISKGSSLLQALASSGGKKLLTGNIEFLRFNDDGTKKFDSFRYDSSATLNSRKNPILMDGDVINVEQTVLGKATTIFGEISNPVVTGIGLYNIFGF